MLLWHTHRLHIPFIIHLYIYIKLISTNFINKFNPPIDSVCLSEYINPM